MLFVPIFFYSPCFLFPLILIVEIYFFSFNVIKLLDFLKGRLVRARSAQWLQMWFQEQTKRHARVSYDLDSDCIDLSLRNTYHMFFSFYTFGFFFVCVYFLVLSSPLLIHEGPLYDWTVPGPTVFFTYKIKVFKFNFIFILRSYIEF